MNQESWQKISEINVSSNFSDAINSYQYNSLGQYEKKFLGDVARLLNVFKSKGEIDYTGLKNLLKELSKGIQDHEKKYIMGLIYPEKIDKAYFFSPIPVKTYTYKQSFTFSIDLSNTGNFLLQVKSPSMYDILSSNSDFMFCNNSHIGLKADPSLFAFPDQWKKVQESRVQTNLFSAYMLLGMSITVKYIGSQQYQAGTFGAGYTLSSNGTSAVDISYIDFNIIQRTTNFVEVPTSDYLKVIYFPPDNSFMEFRIPNEDSISANRQPLSHLIVIYGKGLNILSSSPIQIEVNRAFACIPNAQYSNIFNLESAEYIRDFDSIRNFTNKVDFAVVPGSKSAELDKLDNVPLSINEITSRSESTREFINNHTSTKILY